MLKQAFGVTACEPVVVSLSGMVTHGESYRASPDKHVSAWDARSFPPNQSKKEEEFDTCSRYY